MIDVLPFQLDHDYQDWWGEYPATVVETLWPLFRSGCYMPRYYQAPIDTQETLAAGAYLQFALAIPAGSFVWGILHANNTGFQVQITDVGLAHKWFPQPVPDVMFCRFVFDTNDSRIPYLLPRPYPIVAPGKLLFEFWNPSTTTAVNNCQLVLGVAEVDPERLAAATREASK